MGRTALLVILAVAALVCASSCAAGTANRVQLQMTSPSFDNRQTDCALAEDLLAVPDTTMRVIHARLVQGAWIAEDSLAVRAGLTARFTFWPPSSAACDATAWASDPGGAGCPAFLRVTPTVVRFKPARLELLAL